jgi:hypothetical protein
MMLLNSWQGPAVVIGFGLFVFVLGYWVTPWWTDRTARRKTAGAAVHHRAGAE